MTDTGERDGRDAPMTQFSPRHTHEPGIPPAFDPEGRCLVCVLLVERDGLADELGRVRAERDALSKAVDGTLADFARANADHDAFRGVLAAQLAQERERAQRAEAERDAAWEALKPFAQEGKWIDAARPERQQAFLSSGLTVGDLRRAAAVLASRGARGGGKP